MRYFGKQQLTELDEGTVVNLAIAESEYGKEHYLDERLSRQYAQTVSRLSSLI